MLWYVHHPLVRTKERGKRKRSARLAFEELLDERKKKKEEA